MGTVRLSFLAAVLAVTAGAHAAAGEAAPAAAPPPLLAPLADGQSLPLPEVDPALPSPSAFLGYPLGARFTRYSDVLAYLDALDAASPRVTSWKYGETYEHRPLRLLAISSAANIARLAALRGDRAQLGHPERLADEMRAQLLREMPAVVWLAYGVHGNESSSTEAAMATAYLLAAGRGERAPDLEHTIVLIDPLCNPDGRERYVDGYLQRRGSVPDPDPSSREHDEPWPGGRGNHYYVDLNRDWAWATQQETRARLAQVEAWEPQVYVDLHEMGNVDSTYFFPPTAEPVHTAFGAATRRWLDTFGHANAAAFDRMGWTYFVGENYDFFYPGYGDTYPTLRGGIGMTYEVAGGGHAGSVVERAGAGSWGLADRIARHLTTSLVTVSTAAAQARQLLADFVDGRVAQARSHGRTFLWRDGPEAAELAALLQLHGITVGRLSRAEQLRARPLTGGEPRDVELPAGTWAVSTAQPLGELVQVLLEREPALPQAYVERQRERVTAHLEPEFYDVTAWALPLAYNLDAWTSDDPPASFAVATDTPAGGVEGEGRVGWLLPPSGLAGYRFAASLLAQDVPFRVALEPLTLGTRQLPAGTIFVPREGKAGLETKLAPLAAAARVHLLAADSSLTGGIPLGSNQMVPIRKPRIGLVAGRGTSATAFGALWHLLDQQLGVAHSVLDLERLDGVDLARFDVVVFPEGSGYDSALREEGAKRLAAWVEAGGVLVSEAGAVDWLHEQKLTSVTKHKDEPEESDGEGSSPAASDAEKVWDTELMVPGAIVGTELRHNPLTVGVTAPPPALVWGSDFYDATGDPQQDLLRARASDPLLAGVAWPEAKQVMPGTLLMAAESRGKGKVVVFTQDPAFRLFWRGTMPLLLDAVLYGPSL
ncbi:MAG TPA: M14 family zinc carboxypeptidase [Thermoanaerobaculia bacterium]|nr:M14 family zinc carboxypeptidase [Thermoanaerobaculia bacterium]